MEARLVYVTVGNEKEAIKIGKTVVKERLAACANILPKIKSIYHWEKKLVEDNEAVLILKTKSELITELTLRIKSLHSYSVPCVVSLPLLEGNREYFSWIFSEVIAE
ncbi:MULTISPECIES: divalent-cation tolerance protein CutA [Leptospira]|uniref:Divalent cation tolerance protein, CutA1 family n=5 Tax=Leptospira borgpetersenii TaxID=174 RepID=M3GAR3_LEPBO|nr:MULTISPECIES: divalent-cation tolerance protein CutA [Leptospira]EMF97991.1 divalent cation tolerance protein, CutA1 family [Leptospira borgpetersenii str. 200701203]ANH02153.1 Divalent cation tolerance protein, CutA1 family [Leptospira borgpetersenii str. 4E]AXX17355.1 divalent-cation tolerance protein CutA [Leptospira borgpetersenii serovar Ceylonica]EKP12500.1 divalent cation tolerance protein, CutA1 family [Leptospira borgpetersenii str. 200801926]EMK13850.1 divalent cation tolerance pr